MRVPHSATRAYGTRARINGSRHALQEPGAHIARRCRTGCSRGQYGRIGVPYTRVSVQGGTTARLGGGPAPRPVVGDARGARRRAGAGSGLVVATGRRCPQRGGASPEFRPFVEAARRHHAGRERSLPGRHAGALRRPVPPRGAPQQRWLCSLVLHPFRTPNFARTPLAPQSQARFRSLAVSSGRRRSVRSRDRKRRLTCAFTEGTRSTGAEGVGFEPTEPKGLNGFETVFMSGPRSHFMACELG
jgi:hypothetical protein